MSKVVAIDGPTSSGKDSVATLLSQKTGYRFVDAGAIYRAGTAYILKHNLPIEEEQQNALVFKKINIRFLNHDLKPQLLVDGEDVTDLLRTPEVTKFSPIIASQPKVREALKNKQRWLGSKQNTIMAGRDIGSIIFPDADLKVYLTADLKIRAKRRFLQIQKRNPKVTFNQVLEEVKKRDELDSNRAVSPLKIPDGAIVIDNSSLSVEETVNRILRKLP